MFVFGGYIVTENNKTEQNNNLQKQLLIEQRITNDGKSLAVSYILWWFPEVFGAHRFYLGQTGTAIVMLLVSITFIGLFITFIWMLVDVFFIPGMVRKCNNKLRQELACQIRWQITAVKYLP